MQIKIPIHDHERAVTMEAIRELNSIGHIKSMSQALIAENANLKATKIRAVLVDLIDKKLIEQYQVSDNKRIQRYYYILTKEGLNFLHIYHTGKKS